MFLYIITVHLNDAASFAKTANSLLKLSKNYQDWHWLIKDGGSSEECIVQVNGELSKFSKGKYDLIIENDVGIYDAMNQSINQIKDYNSHSLFLNAGDQLTEEFSNLLLSKSITTKGIDIVYGPHLRIGASGKVTIQGVPNALDFAYLLGKTINHQSVIIRTSLLKKYPFNLEYRVVADWVQLFSLLKFENPVTLCIEVPISIYEGGGYSEKNDTLRLEERNNFIESQYSEWERESLNLLSRIRSREWFLFVQRSLDSPKRSLALSLLSRILK